MYSTVNLVQKQKTIHRNLVNFSKIIKNQHHLKVKDITEGLSQVLGSKIR